jgi:putative colanic acid biosynthesis acetyltransferase WcaF
MILENTNTFEGPSFGFRNRLSRIVWQCAWVLLFRTSPAPLHRWRCWLLRQFGARVHPTCHVYSSVRIWAPWNLEMAAHSCLGPEVKCYSMALVSLGEKAIVSQGVHLCSGSHDYTLESFQLYAKPILIGADAWVCADAFIGPGVKIGEGTVIGARSVVIRSQPSWCVCAGNPSRPLKPRKHPRAPAD